MSGSARRGSLSPVGVVVVPMRERACCQRASTLFLTDGSFRARSTSRAEALAYLSTAPITSCRTLMLFCPPSRRPQWSWCDFGLRQQCREQLIHSSIAMLLGDCCDQLLPAMICVKPMLDFAGGCSRAGEVGFVHDNHVGGIEHHDFLKL